MTALVFNDNVGLLDGSLTAMMDAKISQLQERMDVAVAHVTPELPAAEAELLHRQQRRWAATKGWRLINAADPCGT